MPNGTYVLLAFRFSSVFCNWKDRFEDCCSKFEILYSEFLVEIKKKKNALFLLERHYIGQYQ